MADCTTIGTEFHRVPPTQEAKHSTTQRWRVDTHQCGVGLSHSRAGRRRRSPISPGHPQGIAGGPSFTVAGARTGQPPRARVRLSARSLEEVWDAPPPAACIDGSGWARFVRFLAGHCIQLWPRHICAACNATQARSRRARQPSAYPAAPAPPLAPLLDEEGRVVQPLRRDVQPLQPAPGGRGVLGCGMWRAGTGATTSDGRKRANAGAALS